ncbi:MAG: hypothetical protein KA783_08930 [Chitinophagales bacterium]|jgi:hypothetical protein|nr:hypothetical protein [Chitinophagales bacterium]
MLLRHLTIKIIANYQQVWLLCVLLIYLPHLFVIFAPNFGAKVLKNCKTALTIGQVYLQAPKVRK